MRRPGGSRPCPGVLQGDERGSVQDQLYLAMYPYYFQFFCLCVIPFVSVDQLKYMYTVVMLNINTFISNCFHNFLQMEF